MLRSESNRLFNFISSFFKNHILDYIFNRIKISNLHFQLNSALTIGKVTDGFLVPPN